MLCVFRVIFLGFTLAEQLGKICYFNVVNTFKLLKNIFGIDGLMKLKNIFEDLAHHLHY